MIVSGLIQKLESDSALTALLAYHPEARGRHAIYANRIPQQSSKPLIVIDLVDGDQTNSIRGNEGISNALLDVEIQVEESQGYAKLEAVKEKIRATLNPVGETWGGVEVQGITLSDLRDEQFPSPEKDSVFIQTGGYQVFVWFNQSAIVI